MKQVARGIVSAVVIVSSVSTMFAFGRVTGTFWDAWKDAALATILVVTVGLICVGAMAFFVEGLQK